MFVIVVSVVIPGTVVVVDTVARDGYQPTLLSKAMMHVLVVGVGVTVIVVPPELVVVVLR